MSEKTDEQKAKDAEAKKVAEAKAIEAKIKESEAAAAAQAKEVAKAKDTGLVEVVFTKRFGSYKKGDKKKYHISTIAKLLANGTCKKV